MSFAAFYMHVTCIQLEQISISTISWHLSYEFAICIYRITLIANFYRRSAEICDIRVLLYITVRWRLDEMRWYKYQYWYIMVFFSLEEWKCRNVQVFIAIRPAEFEEPSNAVYRFVLGIKWKLRMSRFRICVKPLWHHWIFCTIQDGVQDGLQFEDPELPY
jgi:hypothetical protein